MNRIFFLIIVLFSISLFAQSSTKAPDFRLTSGDKKNITLSDVHGKVIICFYESKEAVKKNKKLKDSLEELRTGDGRDKKIFVLAVADCSEAKDPFIGLWNKALIDQSKKVGYTLYGDWDGRMRADYSFAPKEANFAIIDSKGKIRYRASGKIQDEQIGEIKKLISDLSAE